MGIRFKMNSRRLWGLKPNLLSSDGTAALATAAFSRCGKYYAYGISLSVSPVGHVGNLSEHSSSLRSL